jgi:leader peptidase (prepilin peptidase)/N-methyltransferase
MLLENLQNSPALLISIVFLVGILIGSFLNLVIYRLPLMMQRQWRQECQSFLELPMTDTGQRFNLALPASHCPHCKTPIKAYDNMPIISFCLLMGKCRSCQVAISIRYPLIELFTGLCSALIAWRFGFSVAMLFALLLTWSLIAQSFIDIDHQLLADSISLPMLWLGLLLSIFCVYTNSHDSVIGAIAGYLSLWSVYQLFKLATGKEGIGYGDFKLLALLGAWLGWQYLPLIIMLSSVAGAMIGIGMVLSKNHKLSQPIPFGPYLAAAGWLALMWGAELNQLYLNLIAI